MLPASKPWKWELGITVHAALQSLGRQRGMRYQHHYTQRWTLCHVISSPAEDWSSLNYTLEHIIHTSTLATVCTVRVSEHNFNVIIIIIIITDVPSSVSRALCLQLADQQQFLSNSSTLIRHYSVSNYTIHAVIQSNEKLTTRKVQTSANARYLVHIHVQ